MIEPGPDAVPDIADDAIDAGLRAWFAVRVVQAGRPILRDRLRAAIATTLAVHHADMARSRQPGITYRPKDYR